MHPGIFDPQVNGYAGIDFQQDHLDPDSLRSAVHAWRRDGGRSFLLTLITDEWTALLRRLRRLRELRDTDPALREAIPGWHLEGPFLSDQPGFAGAHDPACMRDPRAGDMEALREAAGPGPLLVTLSPERPGALDAIAEARRLDIVTSLGHTNASADQLRAAVAAGATGFTHLGNGCPQQLDRHDNIVWRVLDTPGLTVGLIADGLHVSPSLFRLIHRVLPPERLYLTTDAMAAAGAPPGEFTLGRMRLQVGPDGIVRQPGRTNFAGSSARPGQLAWRAAAMLGPLADTLPVPARPTAEAWLGLTG